MLPYILLGFLNYKPMTGYELKSRMDNSTQHFWHAQHSQIYTTLHKLSEQGLVRADAPDAGDPLNRRLYHLTDAGREALREWLARPQTERDTVKHELLVRLFFSAGRDRTEVLDELRHQRRLHQMQLDHYNNQGPETWREQLNLTPDMMADVPFWLATLEFGRAYEAMTIEWLDQQIARLEKAGNGV